MPTLTSDTRKPERLRTSEYLLCKAAMGAPPAWEGSGLVLIQRLSSGYGNARRVACALGL